MAARVRVDVAWMQEIRFPVLGRCHYCLPGMLQFLRRYSDITVAFTTLHRIGDARKHPGFTHGCFEIEIGQDRLLDGIFC